MRTDGEHDEFIRALLDGASASTLRELLMEPVPDPDPAVNAVAEGRQEFSGLTEEQARRAHDLIDRRIAARGARAEFGHLRTLVLGDTHGGTGVVLAAIAVAARHGCRQVVSVGDFGLWPGRTGEDFLGSVDDAAGRLGIDVRVVPGNHDDYDQIRAAPVNADGWHVLRDRVWAAPRGLVWSPDGLTWWMLFGGAVSIDGPGAPWDSGRVEGLSWWADEEPSDDDVDHAVNMAARMDAAGPSIGVMICHDAPARIGAPWEDNPDVDPFPAGDVVRERIRRVMDAARPQLLVHGHWHHAWHGPADVGWPCNAVGLTAADQDHLSTSWVIVEGATVVAAGSTRDLMTGRP